MTLPVTVLADSTLFDNPDDAFIMGNSPTTPPTTDSEITGGTTGRGGCLANWTCTPWSSCINGIQTRNCTKEKSYCYADLKQKPAQSQSCTEKKPLDNVSKPTFPAGELNKPKSKIIEILKEAPNINILGEKSMKSALKADVIAIVIIVFILGWFYHHNLSLHTHRK